MIAVHGNHDRRVTYTDAERRGRDVVVQNRSGATTARDRVAERRRRQPHTERLVGFVRWVATYGDSDELLDWREPRARRGLERHRAGLERKSTPAAALDAPER